MPSLPHVYNIHSFDIREERNQSSIDNSLHVDKELNFTIISGVPAMLLNFRFLTLGEPYEVTCQVGVSRPHPPDSSPSLNLETPTISCQRAPVTTNRPNI